MKYASDTHRLLINTILWTFLLNFIAGAAEIDASVDYEVDGDGFHRTIRYRVDTGKFFQDNCYIALHLSPEPTLYVNVDELADLRRHGETTACSDGEIDVERFAEKANYQKIVICAKLKQTDNFLNLPIHQRYQLPGENVQYTNVTLPMPILLLGCKERLKDYAVSKIDLCSPCVDLSLKWREVPYKTKSKDYIWPIPIGDLSDLNFVTYATLVTICIGTIIILRALWHFRNGKGDKMD